MIFKATMCELEDIIKLHKSVFPHLKWTYQKKYVKETIESGDCYCIKRYVPNSYREIFVGSFFFYRERNSLLLNTIAVDERFRGEDYSREIMDFVEEEARRLGYEKVTLWSKNVGLFEHLGYSVYNKGKNKNAWSGFEKNI